MSKGCSEHLGLGVQWKIGKIIVTATTIFSCGKQLEDSDSGNAIKRMDIDVIQDWHDDDNFPDKEMF